MHIVNRYLLSFIVGFHFFDYTHINNSGLFHLDKGNHKFTPGNYK